MCWQNFTWQPSVKSWKSWTHLLSPGVQLAQPCSPSRAAYVSLTLIALQELLFCRVQTHFKASLVVQVQSDSEEKKKIKKKHFPALESSFFNIYLSEMLQRNKIYLLLIAKLIHLAILSLQASGGRPYFQTFIQFPQLPIQNHSPGAFATYYFCFIVFFLASAFNQVQFHFLGAKHITLMS